MSDPVLFDARDDGIAIITINRPEQFNALNREVRDALTAAWHRFEADPALRIAILTGAGQKAFCAGGDLKEMVETGMKTPPRDFTLEPAMDEREAAATFAYAHVTGFPLPGEHAGRAYQYSLPLEAPTPPASSESA